MEVGEGKGDNREKWRWGYRSRWTKEIKMRNPESTRKAKRVPLNGSITEGKDQGKGKRK